MTTKKHDLLARIDEELRGLPVVRDVTVGGHRYGMKVLDRNEESYSKTLVDDDASLFQVIADTSVPMLAVAIRTIDDTSVEDLFGDVASDVSDERRELINKDQRELLRYVRENLAAWLGGKSSVFTQELWMGYLELKNEAKEALDTLNPLSTTTPSSESRPM